MPTFVVSAYQQDLERLIQISFIARLLCDLKKKKESKKEKIVLKNSAIFQEQLKRMKTIFNARNQGENEFQKLYIMNSCYLAFQREIISPFQFYSNAKTHVLDGFVGGGGVDSTTFPRSTPLKIQMVLKNNSSMTLT